jgi:hypothetical protein
MVRIIKRYIYLAYERNNPMKLFLSRIIGLVPEGQNESICMAA